MKLFAIGAFAVATLVAPAAFAQTAPAAPAAPSNPGPVIAGVCVYNHSRTLAQSTVGQSVLAGMNRLQTEVSGELQPYQTSIQTEAAALQQAGSSLPQDQIQSRSQALQARYREAQQLAETRDGELRYTDMKQREAIAAAVDPILSALYVERGCGILLARENAVLFANPAMDITDTVIQRLNVALPSLSFNRMTPPADQAQQ